MTSTERCGVIAEALRTEGFRPTSDESGMVSFLCERLHFVVFAADDDDASYTLFCPAFWDVDGDDETARAVAACHAIMRELKAIKLYVVGDSVWAVIETFHATPQAFAMVLSRNIDVLHNGVLEFAERMRA